MSLPGLVFITFLNELTEYFTFILQTQSRKIDIKYHCPSVLYSKSFPSSFSIINFLLGLSKPLLLYPITDDFQSGDMIPYFKHHTYISNCSLYIKQTAQVQYVQKWNFIVPWIASYWMFSILENYITICLRKHLEITLGPSFSLLFVIFLQHARPKRHFSHHIGITSVYIFPSAMVTGAVANTYWHLQSDPSQCHAPGVLANTLSASAVRASHPMSCGNCRAMALLSHYSVYLSAL